MLESALRKVCRHTLHESNLQFVLNLEEDMSLVLEMKEQKRLCTCQNGLIHVLASVENSNQRGLRFLTHLEKVLQRLFEL